MDFMDFMDSQMNVMHFMVSEEGCLGGDDQLLQTSNQSINNSQHSIVHCEEYQMHLTWNIGLNNRHFLYEILLGKCS